MGITNTSKPTTSFTNIAKKLLGDYTFDEMGTFTPDQLGIATFDTPFTPVTNGSRVSSAETWGTVLTTWAAETRTWAQCGSLMTNNSKPA